MDTREEIVDRRERTWAEAMRAGRRGDAAAYERLLSEIAELLRGFVQAKLSRQGLGAAETEDVVQEVLIGLHAKRHSWDETRPFMPWLNAIAHYKLVDAVRRLRREARRHQDVKPEAWDDLFEAPQEDPDRATVNVERYLAPLPDHQRDVLRALAVEGTSVRAAAERFGTSEGVIRMTLHRALERVAAAVRIAPPQSAKGGV